MTRAVIFEGGKKVIKSLVPESISPMQGRTALGETAWGEVAAILNAPETPYETKVAIEAATTWRRDSDVIESIGELLGYDAQEIDALFVKASKL